MAGHATKAAPVSASELLFKLDDLTKDVQKNLPKIKELVKEILTMKMPSLQWETFDKLDWRIYQSLSPAERAKYYADAKKLDLSRAYNGDGSFKSIDAALYQLKLCAREPLQHIYTSRRLINELGLLKNMTQKQRSLYYQYSDAIDGALKSRAQRHFIFSSYKPTFPRKTQKIIPVVKVEPEKIKTPRELIKNLRIISKNPSVYLKELREIRKKVALAKFEDVKKQEQFFYFMGKIKDSLSFVDWLSTDPAIKPKDVKSLSAVMQAKAAQPGRPRPTLMPRDIFMPVSTTDIPKAPPAPSDFYSHLGATSEAEAKQKADSLAQSLYNGIWARLMGDSKWMSTEGATMGGMFAGLPATGLNDLFGTGDKTLQNRIVSALSKGDVLGAYNLAIKDSRASNSPFARFVFNDLKEKMEKMRVLIPMVAIVTSGEWKFLETKRISMSVFAFLDTVTSGAYSPKLNKMPDNTLVLSLEYADAVQREIPGGGITFGISPRKNPIEGEQIYVEARVEGRPAGESMFEGAVGTFALGYKDESGSQVLRGRHPMYYAVAAEGTTEGEVRVKGAFGIGLARDINGKPAAVIVSLKGIVRDSKVTPPLTRLSGDVRLNLTLSPKSQLTLSVGAGGLGQATFAYPKWLLGPGIKYERDLGEKARLDLGLDAKFGKLHIPSDVAFNSPMGKFYMLWLLSGKISF